MRSANTQDPGKPQKKRWPAVLLKVLGRFLLVLLETAVLLSIVLYGVMYVLAKGPSPTARDIFVMSVRETSAVGFLADIFFTPEEIAAIEANIEAADCEVKDVTGKIVAPGFIDIHMHEENFGVDGEEYIISKKIKGSDFSKPLIHCLFSEISQLLQPAFCCKSHTSCKLCEAS